MSKKENLKPAITKVLEEHFRKKGIQLEKIVIFGSFASGAHRNDSDIDVIIVSKQFRDKSIFERVKLATGAGRELVETFEKPFDLIYYSDVEWESKNFLIINEAKKHGEVIYQNN